MSSQVSESSQTSASQASSGHRFEIGKIVRQRSTGQLYRITGYGDDGKVRAVPVLVSQHSQVLKGPKRALFECLECGHKFYSVKAAERASFGDEGCPGCGGTDIDIPRGA